MPEIDESGAKPNHRAIKTIGWVSFALGVAAVSLYLGRELRRQYKFNHRTPYDFYANAGTQAASEFGMGI
jgi:hypothetical protein